MRRLCRRPLTGLSELRLKGAVAGAVIPPPPKQASGWRSATPGMTPLSERRQNAGPGYFANTVIGAKGDQVRVDQPIRREPQIPKLRVSSQKSSDRAARNNV